MDLLQILTSFLLNGKNSDAFKSVYKIFEQNSFDLRKVLSSLNPETLAPLVKELISAFKNNTPTDNSVGGDYHLDPIANIADKDIVYTLNKYFN